MDPKQLPVRRHAAEIAQSVRDNPVTVVIGETGSGKTTQISQILEEAGLAAGGVIAVTQPRRVAAVTVARRVAFERDVEVGQEVGYAVRFEDRTSRRTVIKYLTDGTLMREVLEDPLLRRYSIVILDEAHERSLNTDILFGLLKQLALGGRRRGRDSRTPIHPAAETQSQAGPARAQGKAAAAAETAETAAADVAEAADLGVGSEGGRNDKQQHAGIAAEAGRTEPAGDDGSLPPLRLVVTSATLDADKFSAYFHHCPVFRVPGRTFPVTVAHSAEDHTEDYAPAAVDAVLDIHLHQPPGDVLLFLTGQAEIDRAVGALNAAVRSLPPDSCGDLQVLPLYAALPPEMQARVFGPAPPGVRRCVVATNIAETSVTVDGVVYVVDPGVVKQKSYDPRTGMDSLGVVPISRVQAAQRAGRAGRTRPGHCFRLYTQRCYDRDMAETTPPEIQRTSLAGVVLYLKSLPLNIDVLGFDYVDPPERAALEDALRQLHVLDALDVDGRVTPTGKAMAALPLEPSLARALLAAREFGCLEEMLSVAGLLSVEGSVFLGGSGPEQLLQEGSKEEGGQRREQRGGRPVLSPRGRALLTQFMQDGPGDHVLLLRLYQAWQAAGGSPEFCREVGVDPRSMRFARDVRQQLERIMAGDTRGGQGGSSSRHDQPAEEGARRGGAGQGEERRHKRQRHSAGSGSSTDALRHAVAVGFATRLARRMTSHNGYRTLGTAPALAQVHPSCARLHADEDGLLPPWVVYNELMSSGRVYLSGVCPVDSAWVDALLPKLTNVDVARLSGGETGARAKAAAEAGEEAGAGAAAACRGDTAAAERRNDAAAVEAARKRFLARKAAATKGKR